MSLLTRAAATVAATAVALAPSAFSAAHAETIPLPSADTFYTTGADALGSFAAGDPLATRPVTVTLNDASGKTSSVAGTQVVYRTKDERERPSETVTTVLRPAGASRGVVAYLSYYDGLGDICDPSYTLREAAPGTEKFIINTLLSSGYTVTVPDFEGETHDWAAGHEAGWNTLDAIRATERSLGLSAGTTPVGMMGYSGGSIAGNWASELAHGYAPELKLVGTAIGGVPAKLDDVMRYVDGSNDPDADGVTDTVDFNSKGWAGVIPAALVSLGRANGEDFSQYASNTPTYTNATTEESLTGKQITDQVKNACIGDIGPVQGFADAYPDLHVSNLLAPGNDSLLDLQGINGGPSVNQIIHRNEMGTDGVPTMPMLIVQGNKDGTGDGVMVASDVKKLADLYTSEHVPVTYSPLANTDHTGAGTPFVFSAIGFLGRLMPVPPAVTPPVVTPPAKTPIDAKLKGHSKGGKDILTVTAKAAPQGTKVQLFVKGHKKAVGHGKVDKHGRATITVTDHNGRAKTRYQATVAATATTAGDTSKVLRLS